jgi:hypothetical protein
VAQIGEEEAKILGDVAEIIASPSNMQGNIMIRSIIMIIVRITTPTIAGEVHKARDITHKARVIGEEAMGSPSPTTEA